MLSIEELANHCFKRLIRDSLLTTMCVLLPIMNLIELTSIYKNTSETTN